MTTNPFGFNQITCLQTVTVGGASISVSPVVSATTYSSGQVIGGLIAFANAARTSGGTGLIQAVSATFLSGAIPSLDIIFFNSQPSASTINDAATFAIASANMVNIVGVAHVNDSALLGTSAPSIVQADQLALPFDLSGGTTLYAALVARSSATLTSTSDMTVTVSILQD